MLFIELRSLWILGDKAGVRRGEADLRRCENPFEWPFAARARGFARAFDPSLYTVKRHVANINKLGLSSRAQAAAWPHEHR